MRLRLPLRYTETQRFDFVIWQGDRSARELRPDVRLLARPKPRLAPMVRYARTRSPGTMAGPDTCCSGCSRSERRCIAQIKFNASKSQLLSHRDLVMRTNVERVPPPNCHGLPSRLGFLVPYGTLAWLRHTQLANTDLVKRGSAVQVRLSLSCLRALRFPARPASQAGYLRRGNSGSFLAPPICLIDSIRVCGRGHHKAGGL